LVPAFVEVLAQNRRGKVIDVDALRNRLRGEDAVLHSRDKRRHALIQHDLGVAVARVRPHGNVRPGAHEAPLVPHARQFAEVGLHLGARARAASARTPAFMPPQPRDVLLDQLVRCGERRVFAQGEIHVPRRLAAGGDFGNAVHVCIELRTRRRPRRGRCAGFNLAKVPTNGLDIDLQAPRDLALLDALTRPFLDGLE